MATVSSLTTAKMLEIADESIVGGTVNGLGNLILTTRGGLTIDAGPITAAGTTSQYYRGDKTWVTLDKSAVGLGLVDNVSVLSDYIPKWKPNTVYLAGTIVISPAGELVRAKAAITTGTTFVTANWANVTLGEIVTRINYYTNPNFETNITGITALGSETLTRDTAVFDTGIASLKVVTGAANGGVYMSPPALTGWATSDPFSGSIRFKGTSGNSYSLQLAHTGAGTYPITNFVATGAWQTIQTNGGVLASTATSAPYYVVRAIGASDTFWVDNTMGEKASYVGPQFDGSTVADGGYVYAWTGTANASTSTATTSPNAFLPRWKAGKVYAVGDQVVTSTNVVVKANAAHTASAAFATDVAKWDDSTAAKGRMWLARVASNTGAITSLAVVNNLATYTFKGGRKYRIVWDTDWLSSAANVHCAAYIATCATTDAASLTTGLTNLVVRNSVSALAVVSAYLHVEAYYEPSVDTITQVKFLVQMDGGSGNVTIQGNRAGGTVYAIYDEGLQY